jgi:hypothetical protein
VVGSPPPREKRATINQKDKQIQHNKKNGVTPEPVLPGILDRLKAAKKANKCVFIAYANDGRSAAKPGHMHPRKIKLVAFAPNPEQWFDALPLYTQTDPKIIPKKKRYNTFKVMRVENEPWDTEGDNDQRGVIVFLFSLHILVNKNTEIIVTPSVALPVIATTTLERPKSVREWLELLGMECHFSKLDSAGYSLLSTLEFLTEEDLVNVGITLLPHRKVLLAKAKLLFS